MVQLQLLNKTFLRGLLNAIAFYFKLISLSRIFPHSNIKPLKSQNTSLQSYIDYYMALTYKMEIVEDKDEGGFVVSYPDLPGCITCGETIETAIANANDAKKAWIKAALESGIEIQEPNNLEEYSGQFKLRIPRSLHRSLAEHSKKEGISMNQYCVYLLSRNDALYLK